MKEYKHTKEVLGDLITALTYMEQVSKLPDCNTCRKWKTCVHKPRPREFVRINCFDYLEEGDKEE